MMDPLRIVLPPEGTPRGPTGGRSPTSWERPERVESSASPLVLPLPPQSLLVLVSQVPVGEDHPGALYGPDAIARLLVSEGLEDPRHTTLLPANTFASTRPDDPGMIAMRTRLAHLPRRLRSLVLGGSDAILGPSIAGSLARNRSVRFVLFAEDLPSAFEEAFESREPLDRAHVYVVSASTVRSTVLALEHERDSAPPDTVWHASLDVGALDANECPSAVRSAPGQGLRVLAVLGILDILPHPICNLDVWGLDPHEGMAEDVTSSLAALSPILRWYAAQAAVESLEQTSLSPASEGGPLVNAVARVVPELPMALAVVGAAVPEEAGGGPRPSRPPPHATPAKVDAPPPPLGPSTSSHGEGIVSGLDHALMGAAPIIFRHRSRSPCTEPMLGHWAPGRPSGDMGQPALSTAGAVALSIATHRKLDPQVLHEALVLDLEGYGQQKGGK